MKWYPADWRADPKLRMCGLAARGLWADMLALMHEATPYGYLLVSGQQPSVKQLAALVGADWREVAKALAELKAADVYSQDEAGIIYSRRMVRDKAKAETDRENGRRGGNPTLKGDDAPNGYPTQQTLGLTPGDKAQRPEARGQKLETESDADFAAWYGAYPLRKGRGQALKAYQRARRDGATAEDLIAGARRYAADPARKPDFTKHPATWLNGQCWLDDAPNVRPTNGGQTGDTPFGKAVDAWIAGGRKGPQPRLEDFNPGANP